MKSTKNDLLIKPSAAIHIPHKLTLLQQQLWNVLLCAAQNELLEKKIHRITEKDLLGYWPYEMRHTDRLKEALEVICSTTLEFNILDKDGSREWGVFTLLAGAELKNGVCRYDFSELLKEKLGNPKVYAKINLLVQQKFSSKHSLAIYELCIDYAGIGQTGWLELDEFKRYMGLEINQYPIFKDLRRWVIETAVNEINEVTEIKVAFLTKKEGRKISHIKFTIQQKANFQLEYPVFEGVQQKEPLAIGEDGKIIEYANQVGVSSKSLEYARKHGIQVLEIVKALAQLKYYGKPIKVPDALFKKAIGVNWDKKPSLENWFMEQTQHKRAEINRAFKANGGDWIEHLDNEIAESIKLKFGIT